MCRSGEGPPGAQAAQSRVDAGLSTLALATAGLDVTRYCPGKQSRSKSVYGGSILASFARAMATCCASHGPSVPPGLLPDAVSFLVAHRPCPLALG